MRQNIKKEKMYVKDKKDKVGGFGYVGCVGILVVTGIVFLPR